jgi:DNA-binding Xre family transcriptional regulator
MRDSDKLKASENGKAKLREALKNQDLTQQQLADQAYVSIDTVKRLLGTKDCSNGVERSQIKRIAKVLDLQPTEIVDPNDWNTEIYLPPYFDRLIKDTIKLFCGRKFVFNTIDNFFRNNPNGYFTVVGDPGMGKTSIAAKYTDDHRAEAICFFNIRVQGMNSPNLFLEKVRQQLIKRYDLQTADDADLSTLLTKVSEKLTASERLVIVVDALDEVDQKSSGNLLLLPYILPERVYFLLTRRPYNPDEKRLYFHTTVPTEELDLRQYSNESNQDVKEYILLVLKDEKYQDALNHWIGKQKLLVSEFVDKVASKSENNFMYLRHVLPAIATNSFYKDMSLDALPVGLEEYYYNHWQLMGMTTKPLPKSKIKIIYVMSALRRAISPALIAKYSTQDKLTVQEVLKDWVEFVHKQEDTPLTCYRFYHETYIDFLKRQDIVQAAEVSLPNISGEVADIMLEGFFDDE